MRTDLTRGHSLEELEEMKSERAETLVRIDKEFGVSPLDQEARGRFMQAKDELDEIDREIQRIRAVRKQLADVVRDHPASLVPAGFVPRDDNWRLGQPADMPQRLAEGLRTIDRGHKDGVFSERAALRLDSLVRRDRTGQEARYLTAVSNPHYKVAFSKIIALGADSARMSFTDQERDAFREVAEAMAERAMGLTGSAGGFAVPVTLDPTVLLRSNGQVNPFRTIARVETISGSNVWSGVASDGVTAQFTAEATEATDGSPVLAQPTVNVEKAQAFVPFSIEIGEDWAGLTAELGRMLADAKDNLEANKFVTGLGHASHEPGGLLVGATAIVNTSVATTISVADVYALSDALPPRFQPNASWVATKTTFDKVRRLVGPGSTEPAIWADEPAAVLRQLAYEASTYQSSTVVGNTAITVGDFSRFLIVDRIGLQVELVPHLFGTVNNYPTGQRGLYAYWRTSSAVLTPNAFRSLKV